MIDDFVVVGGNEEAFGEIGETSTRNNRSDKAYLSLLEDISVDSTLSAKVSSPVHSFFDI